MKPWQTVDSAPEGIWIETKKEGEKGSNVCMKSTTPDGDQVEWIEKVGGRTTITHHSFAAPTHWRPE